MEAVPESKTSKECQPQSDITKSAEGEVSGIKPAAKEEKMSRSIIIQMILLLSLGILLILFGTLLAVFWHTLLNNIVNKEFVLSPNSGQSLAGWKETPFPLYMKFYMFNWTNPYETVHFKAKPHFTQLGPYVFREHRSKRNLTWNDNSTVTFLNMRKWNYVPEMSSGKLSDKITNLNVIAMTLCSLIDHYAPKSMIKLINSFIMIEEPLYITKSVNQLLFQGYEDPFLNIANKIKKWIPELNLPYDKFAWFYARNMSLTYDGVFNMYTGATDISRLGLLSEWNYSPRVEYFKDKCGVVSGSTGELWPPSIASRPNATIFVNDICSSLTLDRSDSMQWSSYMEGTKFIGTSRVFSNQDKCWCVNNKCKHPSGVRDISLCRFGAPAFMSYPHFYLADPSYNNMVSGLSPNSSHHQFNIIFHQDTGVPLEVYARLQVNIYSQPLLLMQILNKTLPQAMFPMLWFEQQAKLEGPLLDQLMLLGRFKTSGRPVLFTLVGLGVVLACAGIYLAYVGSWRRKQTHQLLPNSDSDTSETLTVTMPTSAMLPS